MSIVARTKIVEILVVVQTASVPTTRQTATHGGRHRIYLALMNARTDAVILDLVFVRHKDLDARTVRQTKPAPVVVAKKESVRNLMYVRLVRATKNRQSIIMRTVLMIRLQQHM